MFEGFLSKIRGDTDLGEKIRAGDQFYTEEDFRDHGFDVRKLKTPLATGTRVMFYQIGCPFCKMVKNAVDTINLKLPPGGAIERINVESYHPLIRALQPSGTPEMYLDGIVVKGMTTQPGARGFLEGFLEDHLVIR